MAGEALQYRSRRGRGVIAATVLGSSVAFLDSTVVNVALPTIERDLNASFAGLQWTVDSYLLSLSSLLLLGGALGDQYGRRRVFEVGLVWFALGSALCGAVPSISWLVVARALQGIGAALLVPGSLAILRSSFDGPDRDAAIGAWAGLAGASTALGPLLGGWLVEALSWRAVFYINLPVVAVAFWVTHSFVPPCETGRRGKLDLAGAATVVVGLGAITYGLIEAPRADDLRSVVAILFVGVAALVGFVLIELHRPDPMLPLAIFRSRQFTGANLTTLAVYFAIGGTTFLFVIYLQQVLGYSALAAGAALLPMTLMLLVFSPVVGRLAGAHGHRLPMTLGPIIAAAGLWLLAGVDGTSGYWRGVLPGTVVLGAGLATTVAPLSAAVLAGAEGQFAGVASGVNNAVARVAGLLAVALLPLVSGAVASDGGGPAAFAAGFPRAMVMSAVLCVVGAMIAFVTIERNGSARGQ